MKHVHAGNCWCPTCWREYEDVCVEHEEPRGDCDRCPKCPACGAKPAAFKKGAFRIEIKMAPPGTPLTRKRKS